MQSDDDDDDANLHTMSAGRAGLTVKQTNCAALQNESLEIILPQFEVTLPLD